MKIQFALLQVRNPDDPMRRQEVETFARMLDCDPQQIHTRDLITDPPRLADLADFQMVLLGGSGDYSVAAGGEWLESALHVMRDLFEAGKPTFASCWGFQAMAAALGGEVVTDMSRAELGSLPIQLTPAGQQDCLFESLPQPFLGQSGHQDIVDRLPPGAIHLARTDRVENQAFTFEGKPLYCTQFHPELDRAAILERLRSYPSYVERIAGMNFDEFQDQCQETPEANQLLRRFVEQFVTRAQAQ